MKGLILDTSSNRSYLLLAAEGKPVAYEPLEGGEKLSKELGARIKKFLSTPPDFIAIGTGPGSYTGVRVGAAMAKTLAFGWQIPLFGFPSLQSFAPLEALSTCAILTDARMGGLYCQKGRMSEGGWLFDPPERLPLADTPTILKGVPLFSPHSSEILKKAPFPQGILDIEPNQTYLSDLFCREAPMRGRSPLEHLSLAYLDGKGANLL
jgi:tRNA threonylcarbamoyl adenosine modification protein YeaZ